MRKNNKKAFSIIEVLIGIFIFSLGMASIFAIISSTLRLNDYNENYIIASNLAREQIEQVRNIRDSNYKVLKPYNLKNPNGTSFNPTDKFADSNKYKIENSYSNSGIFPISIVNITTGFEEGIDKLTGSSMRSYNLCLNSDNLYTYDCTTSGNIKTHFYKFISIEKVKYTDNIGNIVEVNNSFLVKSKVIWYKKGYHEFEVKAIMADWKRL